MRINISWEGARIALLILLAIAFVFPKIGWASRVRPVRISGELSFRSPPRLGNPATLVVTLQSHLETSAQARLLLRLPRQVQPQSPVQTTVYLPPRIPTRHAFVLQFDHPGTYAVQVSVYAGEVIRHFVVYVQITPSGSRVSTRPLPGERVEPIRVRYRLLKRAPGGEVQIQGQIRYFDDNAFQLKPIQRIPLELWEANAGQDTLLQTTTSDAEGRYTFDPVANVDPEDGSKRDLYVVAVFENEVVQLKDASEKLYELSSEVLPDVADGAAEMDLTLDMQHNRRAAGHVFNVMIDAHDFLLRKANWERRPIVVIWPSNEEGSFYSYATRGGEFSDEIYLATVDAWERTTMLHEYGHAVMSAAYGYDFERIPAGEYDLPHYVDTISDPGFALSEGWAEFMEAAVDDNALQLRGYSNLDTPNVEDNAWYTGSVDGDGSNTDGNIVEGAVASILWDITDTAASIDLTPGVDDDDVADRFVYAWRIFTEDFPPDIRTLGRRWQERGFPEYAAVEHIFATHGVPLRSNRPPTLTLVSPGDENQLSAGTFRIAWQVSDPDGDPVRVDLFFDRDAQTGGTFSIARDLDGTTGEYFWDTHKLQDGAYFVLIRATDDRGASVQRYSVGKVIVDHSPLPAPGIASETHPDPAQWVANASPTFTVESESNQFSYVLDQIPDTIPDTNPDLAGTHTLRFERLSDGLWWLHVRAYDPLGYWSGTAHYAFRIRTQPPPAPGTPRWLVDGEPVTSTDATYLELRWDAVSDLSGIVRYEVRILTDGDSESEAVVEEGTQYAFQAQPGQSYEARVRAVNGAGLASEWSLPASVDVREVRPWDVNGDAVVDVLDLTLVALHFGSAVSGKPNPNPDVTGDGWVDILDLVAVGQHFGESYGGAAAPALARGGPSVFLLPNYPNPFNPETWIPFVLLKGGEVQAVLYDSRGRVVRRFHLGYRPAGVYLTPSAAIHWDGRNAAGETVASGSYFFKLQVGPNVMIRRLVVLR